MTSELENILQGQPITLDDIDAAGLTYSCTFGREMPLYTDAERGLYGFVPHDEDRYRLFLYIRNEDRRGQ